MDNSMMEQQQQQQEVDHDDGDDSKPAAGDDDDGAGTSSDGDGNDQDMSIEDDGDKSDDDDDEEEEEMMEVEEEVEDNNDDDDEPEEVEEEEEVENDSNDGSDGSSSSVHEEEERESNHPLAEDEQEDKATPTKSFSEQDDDDEEEDGQDEGEGDASDDDMDQEEEEEEEDVENDHDSGDGDDDHDSGDDQQHVKLDDDSPSKEVGDIVKIGGTEHLAIEEDAPEEPQVNADTSSTGGGGGERDADNVVDNGKESTRIGQLKDDRNYNNDDSDDHDNDDHDDDKSDDDDDDDDSDSSSSSGSSTGSDSDSDDDDDDDGGNKGGSNQDGISDYERLRLERIKRNQARLAQLGLDGSSKMMTDLRAQTQKKRSHKRKNPRKPAFLPQRRSIGRSTKKKINYSLDVDKRLSTKPVGGGSAKKEKQQSKKDLIPPKPNALKKQRTPRFVYDEFKRIAKQRKFWVRLLKKQMRQSQKEYSNWQKKAQIYQHELDRKAAVERLHKQQELERQELGGKTKVELLREIDSRIPELYRAVFQNDRDRMEQQRKLHLRLQSELDVKKRHHLETKMEMIDALDRFPKAMKEAMTSLNMNLYRRSPKDPPPPRRGRSNDLRDEAIATTTTTSSEGVADRPKPVTVSSTKKKKSASPSPKKRKAASPSPKKRKAASVGSPSAATSASDASSKKKPAPKSKKNSVPKPKKKSSPKKKKGDNIAQKSNNAEAVDDEGPSVDIAPLIPSTNGNTSMAALKEWRQAREQAAAAAIIDPILSGEAAKAAKNAKVRFDSSGWKSPSIQVRVSWTNEKQKKVTFKKSITAKLPSVAVPRTMWGTSQDINVKVRVEGSKRPYGPFLTRLPKHLLLSSAAAASIVPHTNQPLTTTTAAPATSSRGGKSTKVGYVRNVPVTGVRNVGGPISPQFAKEIDRTWLEKERPQDVFDLSSYVPQVGETVLYYPSAHFDFLQTHPDHLGHKTKSLLRIPLWKRAVRDKSKKNKVWWTDSWAAAANRATYPLICRVEKTRAEFPPDPYASYRQVAPDGTVTWNIPPKKHYRGEGKNSTKTPIRLAVSLKPLTPILPPLWNNENGFEVDSMNVDALLLNQLDLPPHFSVVTFPDDSVEPFLIPFAWAYCLSNTLSVKDSIKVRSTTEEEQFKGKVASFKTLGPSFGSFRLEDKMQLVSNVLTTFRGPEDIEKAIGGKNLPLSHREATIIIDFLRKHSNRYDSCNMNNVAAEALSASNHKGTLFDLVRSTLPLHKGIGVMKDLYHRQTFQLSRWDLTLLTNAESTDHHQEELVPGLQRGLFDNLENALRVKLVCTLQEFIQSKKTLELFMHKETKRDYSHAVPVNIYLSRILSRLNCVGSRCYYTSVESLLLDIQTITDNCVLYNGPDSDQVAVCNALLPTMKRLLSDVSSHHEKKRKQEEERRMFVLKNIDTSVLADDDAKSSRKKKAPMEVLDGFIKPFKNLIDRRWIQGIEPDGSLTVSTGADGDTSSADLFGWVPQSGDSIFYSRARHSEFVKGHFNSLAKGQCVLPRFQTLQKTSSKSDDTSQGTDGKPEAAVSTEVPSCSNIGSPTQVGKQESNGAVDPDLSQKVHSHWLVGTVVSVRYSFPRSPDVKDGEEESFESPAPTLVVGLSFAYDWSKGEVHEVCWRPCRLAFGSKAGLAASSTSTEGFPCKSCGLSEVSFIRPGWMHVPENQGTVLQTEPMKSDMNPTPNGIDGHVVRSIGKCFDLLKRRCIGGVSPDYVDSKFCLEMAEGAQPAATSKTLGTRPLPSFDDLLNVHHVSEYPASKTITTRGIRKTDDSNLIKPLSEIGFLPTWSVQSIPQENGKKSNVIPTRQDMVLPFPTLCLELVLLRLRNGYYRHKEGMVSDLNEAYVSSILYLLNGPATRRKNRVSIRKIAGHLKARANNQVSSYVLGSKKKLAKKAKTAELEKQLPPPHPTSNQTTAQDARIKALSVFTDEEKEFIAKIEKIRKLYATAIFCVSETQHAEKVFGLAHKEPPKPIENQVALPPAVGSRETAKSLAVQRIRHLLEAVGRESSQNRFTNYGFKNIKIMCDGERVQPDSFFLPANIRLGWQELENNEDLSRCMFGRPKRMFSCVRCQVHGTPFVTCRIRRGHSNPDFGFLKNFKDFGGVDGLLRPLLKPDPTENQRSDGDGGDADSEMATANAKPDSADNEAPNDPSNGEQTSPNNEDNTKGSGEDSGSVAKAKLPKWFIAKENDTPRAIANKFGVDCQTLIVGNKEFWPGIQASSRLRNGTKIRLSQFDNLDDSDDDEAGNNDKGGDNQIGNEPNEPSTSAANKGSEDENSNPNETPAAAGSAKAEPANIESPEQEQISSEDQAKAKEGPDGGTEKDKGITNAKEGDHNAQENSKENGNAVEKKAEEKKPNPIENFENAESALKLASYLFKQANLLANTPVKLSDEFIKSNFPVDPDDGKYTNCIICGLSGHVLCCDTDGCPNVVHPHCVGLSRLPDSDWFCAKCCAEKGLNFSEQGKIDGKEPPIAEEDSVSQEPEDSQDIEAEDEQVLGQFEDTRHIIDRVARHTLRDLMVPVDNALSDLGWTIERRSGKKHYFAPGLDWDSQSQRMNTVRKLMDFLKSDDEWKNHEAIKSVVATFDAAVEEEAPESLPHIENTSANIESENEVTKADVATGGQTTDASLQQEAQSPIEQGESQQNTTAKPSAATQQKATDASTSVQAQSPTKQEEPPQTTSSAKTEVAMQNEAIDAATQHEAPSPIKKQEPPQTSCANKESEAEVAKINSTSQGGAIVKDVSPQTTSANMECDKELAKGSPEAAGVALPIAEVSPPAETDIKANPVFNQGNPSDDNHPAKEKDEFQSQNPEQAEETQQSEQIDLQENSEHHFSEEAKKPRLSVPGNVIIDSVGRKRLGDLMMPVDTALLELGWRIEKKHKKKRYNAPGDDSRSSRLNSVTKIIEFLKFDQTWRNNEVVKLAVQNFDAAILKEAPPGVVIAENNALLGHQQQQELYPENPMTLPKRAVAAHVLFANERRAAVKAANPGCTYGEVSKILSEMWKAAPSDVKKKYQDDAAKRWAAYHQSMDEQGTIANGDVNVVRFQEDSNLNQATSQQKMPPQMEQQSNNDVPAEQQVITDTEFDQKATQLASLLKGLEAFHPPKKRAAPTFHSAPAAAVPGAAASTIDPSEGVGGDQPIRKKRGRPRKNPIENEHPEKKRIKREVDEHGIRVGTTFLKNFEGMGDFEGTVRELPSGEEDPYYSVVYEDGDEEELELSELTALLEYTKKKKDPSASASAIDKPPEEDENGIRIGTPFIKNFEGMGDFKGKVVGFPTGPENPYYSVLYEDGDSEKLDFSELIALLDEEQKKKVATSSGGQPKPPVYIGNNESSTLDKKRKRNDVDYAEEQDDDDDDDDLVLLDEEGPEEEEELFVDDGEC